MEKSRIIGFCRRATEICLWAVIFFLPISIALTNAGLILALCFWLVRRTLERDRRFPGTPLNIFLALLFLAAAASLMNSADIPSSISGLRRLLKFFFLFFVVVDTFRDLAAIKKLAWAMIAGLALVSLSGLAQYLFGIDFLTWRRPQSGIWTQFGGLEAVRIRASMHNPNDFAAYLITLIPLVLSLTLYHETGKKKAFLATVLALASFCILQTHYRGAGLGLVVIMVLFGLIKRDIKPIVALILLVLAVPLILPKPIVYWAITHMHPYDFFVEEGGRRWHWLAAFNMIKAHPVIGIGINTFCHSYYLYKDSADPYLGWYAHSAYLNMAAEMGLAGFLVFMGMIVTAIAAWWKKFRQLTGQAQAISLGVFGGFLGYLIAGLLESNLQYSNLAVLFWFMLGLLVCVTTIQRKEYP